MFVRKGGAVLMLIVVVEVLSVDVGCMFVDCIECDVWCLLLILVGMIEHGPAETRAFFDRWRWLFATEDDFMCIDCEFLCECLCCIFGFVEFDDPCTEAPTHPGPPSNDTALQSFQHTIDERVAALDRFPTGYFRDESGRHHLL